MGGDKVIKEKFVDWEEMVRPQQDRTNLVLKS